MPELYEAAYQRYRDQGADLQAQLGLAKGLADSEYGRRRDRFNLASEIEQQRYDREQDAWARGEKSYQKLVSLISQSGYMPNEEELMAAGMNRAQAEALRKQGDEWVEIFEFAKLHREAYLLANMVTDNKKAQGCLNALKQPENGGYVDRFQNHEQGKVTVDVANVGGIAAAK
jgi:hypothetical protein